MKSKIAGLFSFNVAKESKTIERMWLHLLLAAALSFLPVLNFLEFRLFWDGWFALAGIAAFFGMKYLSRDMLFHPVIVYSFIWIGAALAVFLRLTIMPAFWLMGYYFIAIGWFLPKTEFVKSDKHTDEFVEKQLALARKIRPILIAVGIAMFAVGPLLNF